MTKREKEIITEKVRGAYSILKDYEELYGTNDSLTKRARAEWAALDDLYYELFGKSNY